MDLSAEHIKAMGEGKGGRRAGWLSTLIGSSIHGCSVPPPCTNEAHGSKRSCRNFPFPCFASEGYQLQRGLRFLIHQFEAAQSTIYISEVLLQGLPASATAVPGQFPYHSMPQKILVSKFSVLCHIPGFFFSCTAWFVEVISIRCNQYFSLCTNISHIFWVCFTASH